MRLYQVIGIVISVAIHGVILLIGGSILIHEAEYGISQENSTQVELVAQGPGEEGAAPEALPQAPAAPKAKSEVPQAPKPKSDEVIKPKIHKVAKASQPAPVNEEKTSPPAQGAGAPGTPGSSGHGGTGGSGAGGGGTGSAKPDYMHNPPPEYPEESRQSHEEGVVLLTVEVSENGRPVSVNLKKSSGFRKLDDAALRAVRGWKFKPATAGGVPVSSQVEVPVHFKLRQG